VYQPAWKAHYLSLTKNPDGGINELPLTGMKANTQPRSYLSYTALLGMTNYRLNKRKEVYKSKSEHKARRAAQQDLDMRSRKRKVNALSPARPNSGIQEVW